MDRAIRLDAARRFRLIPRAHGMALFGLTLSGLLRRRYSDCLAWALADATGDYRNVR